MLFSDSLEVHAFGGKARALLRHRSAPAPRRRRAVPHCSATISYGALCADGGRT
jgi:hypothetical protein